MSGIHDQLKIDAINSLSTQNAIDAHDAQIQKLPGELVGQHEHWAFYQSIYYHQAKQLKPNQLSQLTDMQDTFIDEMDISDDSSIDLEMDEDEIEELKIKNLKRQNAKEFDHICRKLKTYVQGNFRKCNRPGKDGKAIGEYLVPIDRISPCIILQYPKVNNNEKL